MLKPHEFVSLASFSNTDLGSSNTAYFGSLVARRIYCRSSRMLQRLPSKEEWPRYRATILALLIAKSVDYGKPNAMIRTPIQVKSSVHTAGQVQADRTAIFIYSIGLPETLKRS